MSKEEEKPTRVTRGALRRMSVEQEPTSAPGTPKKTTATAATAKKLALLDAIQEGSTGPSDAEVEDSAARGSKGKKDTSLVGNRSVHKQKEHEPKATTGRPAAVSMLTEENVSMLDSYLEVRRTPRRRPSLDQTLTPQTLPKRVTRRNSVTSDDGNLGAATPKASRTTRHSIAAQDVIVEDDEKEEQTNVSSTAEADLSDLDIRKLRNRSISKSPVPGKNTSTASIKEVDTVTSPVKAAASGDSSSPQKPEKAPVSQEEAMEESESVIDGGTATPARSDSVISVDSSVISEQQQSQKVPMATVKDVKFDEGTPEQLNKSKYPKTPVAVTTGGKRRKLSELAAESADKDESLQADPEIVIVDETIKDSPQVVDQKPGTPKTPSKVNVSPKKQATKTIIIDETIQESPTKSSQETGSPKTSSKATGTPKKTTPQEQSREEDESTDKSINASIATIVEQIREEMNQSADLSMSILGTPKPTTGAKHKSHFSHLREGSSSTPIAAKQAALDEIPEEDQKEDVSVGSKSWSQAVKGSGKDKGIDVFSVRKKEEEEKQDEEAKTLNESLKRKSVDKMQSLKVEEGEEDGEEEEDEDEIDASQKQSSFVDDEAMEVDGYQSGDSMDSETRAEMEDNQIEEDGESIGSQDTDEEDEEDGDDDSFIASDGEEVGDLLEGTDDELHSEEEADKSSKKNKKKRTRIIQQDDSSEDEQETSKVEKTLNETAASETESPKKGDSSKHLNVSNTESPKKTPLKPVEAKSSKKTPVRKSLNGDEAQEESAETKIATPTKNTVSESPRSAMKSPGKVSSSTEVSETPKSAKKQSTEVPESPKSPKKTPSKPLFEAETQQAKSAEKRRSSKTSETEDVSDVPKSRKSLPTPALISADFYSSSAKKAKRNTIDVPAADEEESEQATPKEEVNSNLVTNPAALALAKKNRRLSQGLSPATKQDKRASLPGKLPDEQELDSRLKKKSNKKQEDSAAKHNDSVEPMEVDEDEEEEDVAEVQPSPKKPAVVAAKKKPRDLSDFDTEAILSRCNEIVRADKVKRKEGATLRQKKKDEKRRQREQEDQQDAAEGGANDESMEQEKKKKKKKKKQINYLLEELGETKEDQVARALQRKMALLEAKRERKKAKKAAKLRQQLNKENQQEGKQSATKTTTTTEGIAAKLEKQAKKAKKGEMDAKKAILEELKPVVKRAVSAFAMYSQQIEEMKKVQADKKKPKSKQLKEKNHHPTAVEEVQAALQGKPESKPQKEKVPKQKQASADEPATSAEHPKVDKQKEVAQPVVEEPVPVKHKKKEKLPSVKPDEVAPKKKKHEQINTAPLKSVVSLDDELAQLKKSLTEPVAKVVKKQKVSHKESSIATVTAAREVTPPRKTTTGKLKALTRLEAGFHEEPITPDHKLLKRNHGFKEEPVTPKSVGFKVSSVLPAGQEALKQEAVEAKRKKTYHNTNRIRPEDVREPARGLPLPVWTRSGTFEVEELEESKSRKASKGGSDYVPLSVNGGNSSTEFLVKPLGSGKSKHSKEDKSSGGSISKVHRIDVGTVDEAVINFKKQAIFGKNAHLREKKGKH